MRCGVDTHVAQTLVPRLRPRMLARLSPGKLNLGTPNHPRLRPEMLYRCDAFGIKLKEKRSAQLQSTNRPLSCESENLENPDSDNVCPQTWVAPARGVHTGILGESGQPELAAFVDRESQQIARQSILSRP